MILRLLCWTVAAMAQSTASFSDADVAPEAQVKPKEPASSSSSKPQSLAVQTSSDEVLCQRGDTGACLRLRELRLELSCRQGNGQACYQLLDSECRRGRLPACTQLAAYSDVHSPNASAESISRSRAALDTTRDRTFALELDPASAFFGKFGGNIELRLAAHHGLMLSGAYQGIPGGPIGEVGYRLYSDPHAFAGFFVGPSFMFAKYTYLAAQDARNLGLPGQRKPVTVGGIALDVGYQWTFASGIVFGLGVGAQYQVSDRKDPVYGDDLSSLVVLFTSTGVVPRLLITVGYSP